MPKIKYQACNFQKATLEIIAKANEIIESYQDQGFDLTLRQLYYQFVARDIIRNKQKEYMRLASIVNDARLAGLIDWEAIVDRTRNLADLSHWNDPSDIVQAVAEQYRVDLWSTQKMRVEVWIEKDALAGILESVCPDLDVPYFSCRGYTSQSEMWGAAMRIVKRAKKGQATTILHFGDHDPSGIDMTRDIEDRLRLFSRHHIPGKPVFVIKRLALNMDQIQEYNPPPNPAKVTDSRFEGYQREHGDESWELDALEPSVLAGLISEEIEELIDADAMDERKAEQERSRERLQAVSDRWDDVVNFVEE